MSRTSSFGSIAGIAASAATAVIAVALPLVSASTAAAQGPGFVGLSSVHSQYFRNEDLLFYVPEAWDRFGTSLATGDFNGDGADDLATGVPYDNGLAGFELESVGLAIVRYGVPGSGLETGLADTVLRHAAYVETLDYFGYALAAGDFNGDGFDDLAVGEPGSHPDNYGEVHIFYGSPGGIQVVAGHSFHQHPFVFAGSGFGSVLAVGNFNGDSFDDLAVGMPYGSVWDATVQGVLWNVGSVMIIEGDNGGLRPTSDPVNHFSVNQYESQIPDSPDNGDRFGFSLAVGNFNGDTQSIGNDVYDFDDLAIGIPGEDEVGAVLILYGSQFNLLFGSSVFLGEWDLGGDPESGDSFGHSLASGDFDGNGADDLAIGAPSEDLGTGGSLVDAGRVTVLYSQFLGPFDYSLTEWIGMGSIYGSAWVHSYDRFGTALAAFRFDPHWDAVGQPFGIASLAIGIPGMNSYQGAFSVLRGTSSGFFPGLRSALFPVGFGAAPDSWELNQQFGAVFATGDFDGNGYDDLAIGDPLRSAGGHDQAGGELVLYGSTFADGFEIGDLYNWSSWLP